MHMQFNNSNILSCAPTTFKGPDAVKYIVNHSELATVVCSGAAFPKLAAAAASCQSLRRIILMDPAPANARSILPNHIELYDFQDLLVRGAKTPRASVPPSADDTFCIMYTSGTTGDPKVRPISPSTIAALFASSPH